MIIKMPQNRQEEKVIGRQSFVETLKFEGVEEWYEKCCICGVGGVLVDLAHKCPAKDGGEYTIGNIVPLCPNHHRLFDLFQLDNRAARQIHGFTTRIKGFLAKKTKTNNGIVVENKAE